MERIYITENKLQEIIEERRFKDHIERYLFVRRFVYGTVIDLGCGIGYGSRLIVDNPDVKMVVGYDICEETIQYANHNFKKDKVILTSNIDNLVKSDVLIAFELIEHIEDPKEFKDYVEMINPNIAIISFPDKPSTSYNKFHYHDYNKQDICNIMEGYIAVKSMSIKDVTLMIFLKAPKDMPQVSYHNFLDIWN